MTEEGLLNITDQSVKLEWKIERFFYLPKTSLYRLESPRFTFSDRKWYLVFYPNGEGWLINNWISLYLVNETCPKAITVTFTVGIKKADDSGLKSFDCTQEFKTVGERFGNSELILKSEFLSSRDVVDQEGTLRLYCSVRINDGQPALQTSPSKNSSPSEIDDHDRELKEKLSTAETKIKNLEQEFKQTDATLSENLKELYRSRYEGDITVRVGDKEFLAHKAILAARSSVFRTMFETDMAEKNDGIVNVEDCEPDIFEAFILFLYGGRFDVVKPKSALKLCLIADKYNVVQLKEACFEIMKKEVSAESVCDAVYLATLYDNDELLNTAVDYFTENMEKVFCTPMWCSFMTEHQTIANELLLKMAKKN